jgi:hypothetical protein
VLVNEKTEEKQKEKKTNGTLRRKQNKPKENNKPKNKTKKISERTR